MTPLRALELASKRGQRRASAECDPFGGGDNAQAGFCRRAFQAADGRLVVADIGGETGEATAQRVEADVRRQSSFLR